MSALEPPQLLLLGLIILGAFSVQSMTGFGATVLALTLGAWLAPLEELRFVLLALNLPISGWVAVRDRALVDRALLLGAVLPAMGAGAVAGALASPLLEGALLRRLFGALVCAFALRELWRLAAAPAERQQPRPRWSMLTWLFAAGLVHGVYAGGGPLVAVALGGARIERSAYRATLMALWFALSAALLAQAAARGLWTAPMTRAALLLLPALPLGAWIGERLHRRGSERAFRAAVGATLLVAGAALLR